MGVQDCYTRCITIDSNVIQRKSEKVKSLYDNLKQKEGEGFTTGKFNASKE